MKKLKADTAAAQVKAMFDASLPMPAVPEHVRLRTGDEPFWDGIVRARARDEWTEADLVVAAQLARCQKDIEVESLKLEGEDTVMLNERGTMVCNPRLAVLEQLARREMAFMRSLRMGGRVAGDARDEMGKRKLQRGAVAARKELEDDELLA